MPPFLATIQAKIIGGLLVVALIGGVFLWVFNKGEKAGSSAITTKVQQETIKTLDKARQTKDQADRDVKSKPYDERVDGLK